MGVTAHIYDGQAAGMWSVMSHKSSSIFSVVMAERDESLSNPLHLIHMSICLLSMPLSKDYWCPTFDIWHIMCHNISSHELTWRRGQKSLTDPFFVSRSSLIFCLWVLWHSWFIGEVLSDLWRTNHYVVWCVSPYIHLCTEMFQLIFIFNRC